MKLFLSYARADDDGLTQQSFVRRLYNDLTKCGIDVWWDRERMPSRALTFLQEIRDAVDAAERLILIVGPGALRSEYVRAEWGYALSTCKTINPLLRSGDFNLIPEPLRLLDTTDFRDDSLYESKLAILLRQINIAPAPLGPLIGVPALPPHFLPRNDMLNLLKASVLADTQHPVVVTESSRRIGIQGMGGIGKTVIVSALARDCETRRVFPDGVFWISIGREPSLLARQAQLIEMLGGNSQALIDTQQGKARLSELLNDRACLLILDDVWQAKHADVFDVLGPRCRMVITTRDAGLIAAMGAVEVSLDLLSDEQALHLLAAWAEESVDTLPAAAHEIVRECGNLPLALAMIGARVRSAPNRWLNMLHKLRNADLEKIQQEFPDYPYPNLLRAIQVSIESLGTEAQKRYHDFAIFQQDAPIPEGVFQTFWAINGLDQFEVQDILDELVRHSLAHRDNKGHLRLHDLLYDYVRKQAGDLLPIHNRLLDAYATKCPNGWATGPNDGYFYGHLIHHLREAGRTTEIEKTLSDLEFMSASVASGAGFELLASYQQTLKGALSNSDSQSHQLFRAIAEAYTQEVHELYNFNTVNSRLTTREFVFQQLRNRIIRNTQGHIDLTRHFQTSRSKILLHERPLRRTLFSQLIRTRSDGRSRFGGSVRFTPNRELIAATVDHRAVCINPDSGFMRTQFECIGRAVACGCSADGKKAVLAGDLKPLEAEQGSYRYLIYAQGGYWLQQKLNSGYQS